MSIVTRRQLCSLYGAWEAGEFLYEERRKEIALAVADRYLEFAEKVTRGQFLYAVNELDPKQLKMVKHMMSPQSYKSLIRYIERLAQGLPVTGPRRIHIDEILNAYDDVILLYEKSDAFLLEPGFMTTKLIATGYARLREARRKRSIDSVVFAIDFINNLHHSEGQLITWLDEDCEKEFAAYTLTLVSASVYQPEALAYMHRDIRVALRMKARFYTAGGVFDPYDRLQFLDNFVKRLGLLDEFTAQAALEQVDSLSLIRELLPRIKKGRRSSRKGYLVFALQDAYRRVQEPI